MMDVEVRKSIAARLYKLYEPYEYHGWIVKDAWVHNKHFKNYVPVYPSWLGLTNDEYEISYVTREKNNPLPFHGGINYVGIIHTKA